MDEREWRFVVEFLWLQGLGGKAIYTQLSGTLAESPLSLSTVQRWLRRFKEGNTLCEDAEQPSRQKIVVSGILGKFLAKYAFVSARPMSRYFGVSASTVKEILIRELGFKK
jgi:hypothetical protein